MNEEYNSRERKIYSEYKDHPTDNLLDMLNNDQKYISQVLDVIRDILVERNVLLPSGVAESPVILNSQPRGPEEFIQNTFNNDISRTNEAEIKSFVNKLRDKTDSDLTGIITRYIEYKQETVMAALIVSVDRGLISYDLKGLLAEQIDANFSSHARGVRRLQWERNNAFAKFFSGYSDDEIYEIIEDPGGIVLDAYHGVLLVANERELISAEDFNRLYKDSKLAIRTESEIERAEFADFLKPDYSEDDLSDFEDEIDIEAEKEKYWKCPVCNQLVEMEFGMCWNCQSEIPPTIEHPDKAEVIREISYRKPVSVFKIGFTLIGCGIAVGLLEQLRHHSLFTLGGINYGGIVIGAFLALIGIVIIIYGLIDKARGEA